MKLSRYLLFLSVLSAALACKKSKPEVHIEPETPQATADVRADPPHQTIFGTELPPPIVDKRDSILGTYWGWGHRVTNTGGQYLFDSVYILKLDADSILVKSTHFNFRFYFPDSLANKNNYTFKNPYIKNNLYYEQVLSVHFGDVTTRDISLFDGTTGINQDTKSLGAWRVYK